MDSLIACYVGRLHDNLENENNALSIVVLLHEVLNAEQEKKDLNLEILFKETTGILPYLKQLSRKKELNKDLIKEVYNLIKTIIIDFTDTASKYVPSLVEEFCEPTIIHSECADLRTHAYDLLLLLIKTPGVTYFQSNMDWLNRFYQKLLYEKIDKNTSSTEKKKAYELLGEIINYAPELLDTQRENKIFRLLSAQIRKQLEYQKKDSASFRVIEIEGLYNCLQLFLQRFHDAKCVKDSKDLYSFVKDGCGMVTQHRKTSIRAAFKILENHFDLFANNVFEHFTWWTELLTRYLISSNKEDQLAAFHVLNAYYRGISKILKKKPKETETLKYFINYLRSNMKKNNSYEVALAVENFGHFAKVCTICNEKEELEKMFEVTFQKAENYCSGQVDDNIELHHMSSLLVSMAKIIKNMYNKHSYEEEFAIAGKFSAFIVVSYPKVPNNFRYLVRNNLIRTIIIMGSINDAVLDSYLQKLIFMSLIKCCSCPLKRDIEYLNSLGNTGKSNLFSCSDYIPLWKAICNIENELMEHGIVSERKKIETVSEKQLPSKVFDAFMKNLLDILEKLDYSVIEEDCYSDEIPVIDDCGFKPKIESDFYIFINLVELFSVVVESSQLDVFEKWIPELIKVFVKLSASCSIKSGFFQLFSVIFQRANSQESYEQSSHELKSFLMETMINIRKLKGVDLSSCLRMILKIPHSNVEITTPYIVSILQIVFTQGLEDLSLARSGLESLRSWRNYIEPKKMKPIIESVIPLMNPYLQSKKSIGDVETLTKYEEHLLMPVITQPKNKVYKKFHNMHNHSSNVELLGFQKEILAFLGDVEIDLCKTIYNPEKQNTNEFTEVLRFEVPFQDKKVRIFLDKCLPRIIELTAHNNLKTRFAACEVLHSMTVVFLGNTIASHNFDQELPKPTENLFKRLLACIFKLGCDNNVIIKVMFSQLSYQIVRYYSCKYQNIVTAVLLEMLFESVSHAHDVSLSHFSAGLIKELVCKSLEDRTRDVSSVHILAVVKHICLFSLQPCVFKRRGAASAFNSIYRDLRENKNLINIYWIELLVHFVRSSLLNTDDECDDETSRALQHIRRVILEKVHLFNESNGSRRVPKCLRDGTLKSVISWMLRYCVAENKLCRNKCMELILDLCDKIPEFGSLKMYFHCNENEKVILRDKVFVNISSSGDIFNHINTRGDKGESYRSEFAKKKIKWLKSLQAGLHCLSWLLKGEILTYHSSLCEERFLNSMKFFCESILPNTLNEFMTEKLADMKDDFISVKLCTIYENLKYEVYYEYLNILSASEVILFDTFVGNEDWQTYFWQTFISYLFAPSTFAMHAVTRECLAATVPKILSKLKEISPNERELIFAKIRQHPSHDLFDIFIKNIENCHFVSLNEKNYINTLQELQRSEIIIHIFQDADERKRRIINRLFEYVENRGKAKSCNPTITIQLEPLLAFAMADQEVSFVLELLTTSSMLLMNNSAESTISHGRHFFNTFRKPIAEYLSHCQKQVVDTYLSPHLLTKEKLQIVIDCLKFVAESSKLASFDEMIEAIFNNWSSLMCWNSNGDCSQYLFSLIDAVVVDNALTGSLCGELKYPVFLWLINNLLNEKHFLTRRKEYFKLLTPFISNTNERNDAILRNKLKEFRDKFFDVSSPHQLKDAEYVNTFKALLSLFSNSGNMIVFEIVILIGASDKGQDCDISIQQTLEILSKRVSAESQLEFLNATFSAFKNSTESAAFRLNCIQKFLVPLLYTSNVESLKMFFSANMEYVVNMLKQPFSSAHQSNLETEAILLKTAAVSVVEVYSDLECEEIKRAVSVQSSNEKRTVNSIIGVIIRDCLVNPVKLKDPSNGAALRVLKCQCYKTLIKMVQKVPKDVNYYRHIFHEDFSKKRLIWQSIIDCNEEINLKMCIDEIPARSKALKQKRKELKSKSVSGTSTRSIPTQYLSTSSLVSNVKYDMSEWNISNEGYIMQAENKSYTIDLEEDKLNNHECMTTICELIMFIVESNVSPLPDLEQNPVPEPPLWMECLRASLKFALKERQKNIVLYFLKMIYNCKIIFCPYAKSWIDVIIDCLLMLNDVNYLTVDIIVTMISWSHVYIPTNKKKNNDLMILVLKNISLDMTTVRNYQLDLLRLFIKYWHEQVDVPYAYISSVYDKETNPVVLEVHLIVAKCFLMKGVLPFLAVETAASEFSNVLLFHVERNGFARGIKILIFEVLALILNVIRNKNILPAYSVSLQESLIKKLNSLKVDNTKTKTDLFFSCVQHTLIYFPAILHRFLPYLLSNFLKFQGKIKAQCLNMIALDIDQAPENTFSQLMSMQFANCLRESNHEILTNALITLKKFINIVKTDEIHALLPDIIRLSSHASSECRELVYEIANSVYIIYRHGDNEDSKRIESQCKVILLNGLLDTDKKLQEKIFSSWKDRCKLSEKIVERFVSIVRNMYSPQNESRFVNYATDFLLDACFSTPDFKSKIFDNPLSSCEFREQDLRPLTMLKNKHPIAPMFVNSLSNQLVGLSLFSSKMCTLVLPGSQKKLYFQPSQDARGSAESLSLSNSQSWAFSAPSTLKDSSIDEPEIRKLQNRLHTSQTKASQFYAKKNIEKREKRFEILKQKSERAEKDIQFSRTYRDGEFPDIEIPRSAVVTPLKILAKRDPVIARLVFISIFDGMWVDEPNKKKHLQTIGDGFNKILQSTLQHDTVLIETIFETVFFHSSEIQLESQNVVISSHASGLLSLGALILENSLLAEISSASLTYAAKRLKVDDSAYHDKWIQLAELYKALDKNDIVNGILKEKIEGHASESLKRGLEFERICDWKSACNVYKEKIDQYLTWDTKSFEENFIFDTYLKCAANLSRWTDLKNMITRKFKSLDDLWQESWDIEHTLPWFFTAEAITCVQEDAPSDNLGVIKTWMLEEDKSIMLNNLIAESMSILLFLNGENFEAKYRISKSVESILQNWSHSTSSLNKFYQLLTLSEIDSMLMPYEMSNCNDTLSTEACQRLLKMWTSNVPRNDNLYWWDKRIMYRQRFACKYEEQLGDTDEAMLCVKCLKDYNTQSSFQMVEVALQQKNEELAIKYLVEAQLNEDESMNSNETKTQLTLNQSKVLLLQAEKSDNLKDYVQSLKILESFSKDTKFSYTYHMHLANSLYILQNKLNTFAFDKRAEMIDVLKRVLNRPNVDNDTARVEMQEAIIEHYKEAATFAENCELHSPVDIAASYLSLAKYCKGLSDVSHADETLVHKENYIRSILRALKFDSTEAQLLFPTLLQLEQITNETLKSVFISESAPVEEWKFLTWIQQLLAHIDSDILPVIEKLLLSIIEKYPNAIQFSFFSSDLMRFNYRNNSAIHLSKRLREILNRNSTISDFIKAISCVRVPDNYFKYCLKKLSKLLRRNDAAKIDAMKWEIFVDDVQFKGKLFTENKWWEKLSELFANIENKSCTTASLLSQIDNYLAECDAAKNKSNRFASLEYKFLRNYSSWFDNFTELANTNIEIPGQYDAFRPPDPERHVKIFEFDSRNVQIQQSVQAPIKIQVIGNDAKKYSYLVKFGEDTRQDQRIQQIFSIMNRCSASEAAETYGNGDDSVSVITYGVFPLTSYFGIIEWLEGTISLRDFMDYELLENKKKESKQHKLKLRDEYSSAIANYCPGRSTPDAGYEEAVKILSKTRIITTFENLRSQVPSDVFKRSILALCNSPVMYWNLRNQFVISYSTLCMYGWILGIGDRHLDNFLVCLRTGRCIGIDFGHAFGTGTTYLPIPELIPFRMTPHIVSIMAPFNLTGLIRETMFGALKTIHDNEYILFATMQIFILDPSFNWLKSIKKQRQELTGIEESNTLEWYPAHKMERIKRKLQGINPIKIIQEEVEENGYISTSYKNACMKLLKGEDSSRSNLPVDNISLAEQIECLLDIATDKCILGTSWVGLETYI